MLVMDILFLCAEDIFLTGVVHTRLSNWLGTAEREAVEERVVSPRGTHGLTPAIRVLAGSMFRCVWNMDWKTPKSSEQRVAEGY